MLDCSYREYLICVSLAVLHCIHAVSISLEAPRRDEKKKTVEIIYTLWLGAAHMHGFSGEKHRRRE